MKIIKYPHDLSPRNFFQYSLIVFDNYVDIDDKLEVLTVFKFFSDSWYRKIFINRWWYIPLVEITITKKFELKYWHVWYDIQQHGLWLGFIQLHWEGSPEIDRYD